VDKVLAALGIARHRPKVLPKECLWRLRGVFQTYFVLFQPTNSRIDARLTALNMMLFVVTARSRFYEHAKAAHDSCAPEATHAHTSTAG